MKKFIAGENYVINTSKDALVRISFLDQDFRIMFLGKNEEWHKPRKLECKSIIIHRSGVIEKFIELGGSSKAAVDLQDILEWAKDKCLNYEENLAKYCRSAFAFFCYDTSHFLRIIKAYFTDEGLQFYAFETDDLDRNPDAVLINFIA